MAARQSPSVR
jgi:RNA polymerase sigma-70 factor (ECF subfamily)